MTCTILEEQQGNVQRAQHDLEDSNNENIDDSMSALPLREEILRTWTTAAERAAAAKTTVANKAENRKEYGQESRNDGRRKTVHWNMGVTVYRVESVLNLVNPKEYKEVWYSKSDYKQIRAECKATVQRIKSGQPELFPQYCYRGLEYKTTEKYSQRRYNIGTAEDIVWLAQHEKVDVETLANRYSDHARHCALEAQMIGIVDAKEAREYCCLKNKADAQTSSDDIVVWLAQQHTKGSVNADADKTLVDIVDAAKDATTRSRRHYLNSTQTAAAIRRRDNPPSAPRRTWAPAC